MLFYYVVLLHAYFAAELDADAIKSCCYGYGRLHGVNILTLMTLPHQGIVFIELASRTHFPAPEEPRVSNIVYPKMPA